MDTTSLERVTIIPPSIWKGIISLIFHQDHLDRQYHLGNHDDHLGENYGHLGINSDHLGLSTRG